MSLAEFGEIPDQQLAKGTPVPALGGLRSGGAYLKPAEDDGAPEGSEPEEIAEELTDVDKPGKEHQKVSPVDCTTLGKAKQRLCHVINMLIHSAYYSVLMNWSGWNSRSLTPIKAWLVESNLKKHETSGVVKIRGLEMEYLLKQECHHITLYITQLGIDIKELLSGPGDQRMNNAVWRKISHLDDPVAIASVITRSPGGNNLQDQERALDKFKEHVTATAFSRSTRKRTVHVGP
jgi:hypothetical protein